MRDQSRIRFEGIASVCLGGGSIFFLLTAGVPLVFGVVAIATIADERASGDKEGTVSLALLLVLGGLWLTTLFLDLLLLITGIRILRSHPSARKLALIGAIYSLAPVSFALALRFTSYGSLDGNWFIPVASMVTPAFACCLAASLWLNPPWKTPLDGQRSPA